MILYMVQIALSTVEGDAGIGAIPPRPERRGFPRKRMKSFTDPIAAIEEAEFLAQKNGRPYAVVCEQDKFFVLPLRARVSSWLIVEICRPSWS